MIPTLLIVEDDDDLRNYLRDLLIEKGYSVHIASHGAETMKIIQKIQPNLIVLDLGLPDMKGETLCAEIKDNYPETSIIILTARNTTSDVVIGLNLGADDYITKPFEGKELLARIQARLRSNNRYHSVLTIADLQLNNQTMEVFRGEKPISLTAQEFKLLEYLIINKGKVLSRDMILNRLWLSSPDIETRVVDVYIGYLRKKIDAGFSKKLIQSVRGFGYVIRE